MTRKWTKEERQKNKDLLRDLYKKQNKTIKEIGFVLGLSEKTIYKRLKTLSIKTNPQKKIGYLNKRKDFVIPKKRTKDLAEFFGVMLGDGKLSPSQIIVTLGNKEKDYVSYVQKLFLKVFKVSPRVAVRAMGYHDVYLGSVDISRWLQQEGLVFNKVKSQVDAPGWIFGKKDFINSFVRGFFDTDGSVYNSNGSIQVSFSNKSIPLLKSLQKMLYQLEYNASGVSHDKFYITRRADVLRFFSEVRPRNKKHIDRFVCLKRK